MSNIMKLNNAKETIIKQLITGSGGLFVGGSLITGLVLWANTWGVQFFDGSEYDFGVIRWFGYVSMVFIVGLIIHIQFVEALTAQEVFGEASNTQLLQVYCLSSYSAHFLYWLMRLAYLKAKL